MDLTRDVMQALGAPFGDEEVDALAAATSGDKAMAVFYVDARTVMARLDYVVGPAGWSFDFDPLTPDGKRVRGKLTILGVTKCDAGEADKEDEPLKSAVSDALKRCAVHFGCGRYLYHLPRVWAAYDREKRRFSETPHPAPAAVQRALRLAGILPAGKQPPAEHAPAEHAPAPAAEPTTAPPSAESSGDREAVRQAPSGGKLAINAGAETCPGCGAPSGKPHTRVCPSLRPV